MTGRGVDGKGRRKRVRGWTPHPRDAPGSGRRSRRDPRTLAEMGVNGPATSGGKIVPSTTLTSTTPPGDEEEPLYEPVSLVASVCKPTWFPLCPEAAVRQGKECPCHTVGACGRFFWWARGPAPGCASPSEPRPSGLPCPQQAPPGRGTRLSWALQGQTLLPWERQAKPSPLGDSASQL